MAEKSKEKIVRSVAESICSGHYYISALITRYNNLLQPLAMTPEAGREFFETLLNEEVGPVQTMMSNVLKDLREKGLHGIDAALDVFPKVPGIYSKYTIFAASNRDYLYIDPPQALLDLYEMPAEENEPYRARIDKENTYMLFENGIPELGLKGEYLATSYRHTIDPTGQLAFWFFDFKPMHAELTALHDTYEEESTNTLIVMGIVTAVSVIVVAIITFFYLSFLIRKEITGPVDELAAAAEEVMNGNIDLQVPVKEGEELEDLKKAVNSMLRTLNEIIERGMSGD